jgi:MoaA/NifB/PqqE/SkfB family radical SAM enzyme
MTEATSNGAVGFLWLEITGRCNLRCVHCYADSGPNGAPDRVGTDRWLSLIEEAPSVGVRRVQFIGGEPTVHPDLQRLVVKAADAGLDIEIYSNLTHIRPSLWSLFAERRVSLATSFYSEDCSVHDSVTRGRGSQARTLVNIKKAIALGVPLRVGIIEVNDSQDIAGTVQFLRDVGVEQIGVDRQRGVGRGAHSTIPSLDRTDELCGYCAHRRLAIDPDGCVYPCVMSRWLPVGNVKETSLGELSASSELVATRMALTRAFAIRQAERDEECYPAECEPTRKEQNRECRPAECEPLEVCGPNRGQRCEPPHPCPPGGGRCPCPPFTPCDPTLCEPVIPCPPFTFSRS